MARRFRLLAFVLGLVLVLASCDVDIGVEVDVNDDGSGLVTLEVVLDEDAAARVPNLESELAVTDLIAAGWEVTGPLPSPSNGVSLTATKPFNDPDQLQDVLDDITGPDGIFRDFSLSRTSEFAQADFDLSGTIDPSRGVDLFSDSGLVEALDGRPLGIDLGALEAEIGPIQDAVRLSFKAELPGSGNEDSGGASVEVASGLGDPPIPVSLSSTSEDQIAKILRLVGYAAAVLAVVSLLVNSLIWFMERRKAKKEPEISTPGPVRAAPPAASMMTPSQPRQRVGGGLSLVVIDGYGVLYEPLLPQLAIFAEQRGSTLDRDEVSVIFDAACDGSKSTAELWSSLGIEGDPAELDVGFVSTIQVRTGAVDFVGELRRRGMHVAALANNVSIWSDAVRARDDFSSVAPWITSSEAGVRSPHPGLYEAVRRATGVPFEDWLMIHADLEALEAAKTLGVSTVWFTRELPPANNRPAHALVAGFSDFFRRR